MNGIGFQLANPSRGSGGKIPSIVEKPILTGYSEAQGALLIFDGTEYAACGTDPATIAAIALTPGGADTSGFNILGRKEFPALTMQGILPLNEEFLAPFLGAIPATTGDSFGVTRDTDGVWKLDFNKPDKLLFTFQGVVTKSPADAAGSGQNTLVLCQILPGVVQQF